MIIVILGLLAGYREVQILCERGSWNYMNFRPWFWFTNQADKKVSNWDSFHISNGIFTLVLAYILSAQSEFVIFICNQFWTVIVHIIFYWIIYMYSRDFMMHIILPFNPRWWKIIPLFGDILENIYKKKANNVL